VGTIMGAYGLGAVYQVLSMYSNGVRTLFVYLSAYSCTCSYLSIGDLDVKVCKEAKWLKDLRTAHSTARMFAIELLYLTFQSIICHSESSDF
jgi:hypothetical protein